jgi:hypothetical protein
MDDFCQRSWEQDGQLGLALSSLEYQEVPLEEDVLAVPIYLKEPVQYKEQKTCCSCHKKYCLGTEEKMQISKNKVKQRYRVITSIADARVLLFIIFNCKALKVSS